MNETTDKTRLDIPAASESTKPQYKGVGGWLLFLCLALTVFGPLSTLGVVTISFNQVSSFFDLYPGLMVITAIDAVLSLILSAFSIYAGIGLWRVRSGAVQMAKRYLLCVAGYLVVAAILPFMSGVPSAGDNAMIMGALTGTCRGLLFIVIWYSYLNKSKRVRNTYSSDF